MKKGVVRALALFGAAAAITGSAQALSVEEAYELLRRDYVDRLPAAAKEAGSLDELFSYTDEYTCYMSAEEYAAFLQAVEGEESFFGIGAEIAYREEGIELLSVLAGGGAEKAGLRAGDIIVAIEGESCAPGTAEQRAKLLGEEGTRVRVTVRHADGTRADYTITRAAVTRTNTTVTAEDGVGYIDCDSFGTRTGTYFQEGVKKYDGGVRAWIVDLRGNGGGLTSAAVTALGTFAGAGELVYLVDRDGETDARRYTGSDLTDKPLIVLTDGGSASSSEIFAGGAAGTGCGIVLGTRSYGKGVAQVVLDETNSPYLHGDAVKLTAYRFYCAGGSTSDRIGVLPTLYIPQDCLKDAARLLAGAKGADGGAYVHLVLNGCDFYIDLADARESAPEALEAILTALAPDAELYWGEGGGETALTPAQARERCGYGAAALGLSDVSGSEYGREIETLAAYRIVLGDNGRFRPDDTMTRAEVCALLAQALDLYSAADGYFTDVPAESWYAPSVNAMAALGLVSGAGGGLFRPDDTMTQEELITVLGRLAEFLSLDAREFLDENPLAVLQPLEKYKDFSPWAIRCAALLTSSATDGDGEAATMFFTDLAGVEPRAAVTRGQAAAALCSTLRAAGALRY